MVSDGFGTAPTTYDYDPEGNRLSVNAGPLMQYDAANRLLNDGVFTYQYDANGNLAQKTAIASGETTTFAWDVQDRLLSITAPDGTLSAYRYDAHGRRIEKDVNGSIVRYVYDGDAIVLEYDDQANLVARFGHGIEIDQPLTQERGSQNFFYHTDYLGSVRRLSNAAGDIVNSYDFDSFGRNEITSESVANPYRFAAREFDPESGLYFNRARYYDPGAGRFISQDPACFSAGDLNLYRYVFNRPTDMLDPTGETAIAYGYVTQVMALTVAAAILAAANNNGQPPGIVLVPSGPLTTPEPPPPPNCQNAFEFCIAAAKAKTTGLGFIFASLNCSILAIMCVLNAL